MTVFPANDTYHVSTCGQRFYDPVLAQEVINHMLQNVSSDMINVSSFHVTLGLKKTVTMPNCDLPHEKSNVRNRA